MLVDFKASTFLLQPEHRYLFSPESLSALTYYFNECYSVTYSAVFGICRVNEQFSEKVFD